MCARVRERVSESMPHMTYIWACVYHVMGPCACSDVREDRACVHDCEANAVAFQRLAPLELEAFFFAHVISCLLVEDAGHASL